MTDNILSREGGNELSVKEEILTGIFSILAALFVYSGIAFVTFSAYHPNVELLKSAGDNILIGGCRPEPVEALLFRLAVVAIPLGLVGSYRLFSKLSLIRSLASSYLFNVIYALCIVSLVALIYFDFAALNPFGQGNGDIPQSPRDFSTHSNFDFYFKNLFLGQYLVIYNFVTVPAIACLLLIRVKKFDGLRNKYISLGLNIAGYIVLALVLVCIVLMNIFQFPYQSENQFDFSSVYYSMTQVYAGLPMLVNGFTNAYGLYPHFLNPLFKIAGLSIFNFSLVMSLLAALSFVLNFYSMKQFIRNKYLLWSGILTVVFFTFLDNKFTEKFDADFAFFSIRYIIPSTLIFLSTLYLRKKSAALYWITTVIMAFFVLWNPEFGIVSFISWLLFNSYNDLYDVNGQFKLKKVLFHWVAGTATLIIVFYAYKLSILLLYGAAPDLSLLWTAILVFSKYGFGLLPMTLIHPWNLVALVLIVGLAYSLIKLQAKNISKKSSIVFLTSILGTGIFFYFQGRSHNWNLALSSGMALLLLCILGDELLTLARNANILLLKAMSIIILYIVSFSFFEISFNSGKLFSIVFQGDDKLKAAEIMHIVESGKKFIRDNSSAEEKIYVLTLRKYECLFFDDTKRKSAFNPGMSNIFLYHDFNRMQQQLIDSSYPLFITPPAFNDLKFMAPTVAAIAATYEYSKSKESMTLLQKRKTKIPQKTFFEHNRNLIFHKKYTDDSTSIRARIDDAAGINPVTLVPEFSVEILFDAKSQIFNTATLVGNQAESAGFSIGRILNSPNCLFCINSEKHAMPIPNGGWTYCVFNVYPDKFDIYVNGNFTFSHDLQDPIRNSEAPLSIGNLGNMHHYIGAISEVAISRYATDSNKVKNTWREITDAIK